MSTPAEKKIVASEALPMNIATISAGFEKGDFLEEVRVFQALRSTCGAFFSYILT
jgi:hypothetical protein